MEVITKHFRNKKKNELMKKFFDLNIKEMKDTVNKQLENFLKNKKNKLSESLKTNIEKCN